MLKKASKEKDERMNKIKAVALKAKKELDHSKKEVWHDSWRRGGGGGR